ncbi:hypothetical protein [Streptomyces graminilatus]|uniref:hypothetical protein n=1 Tax=Streptomyces graminilatus TaxID=1464070 RepID=UPI000A7A2047|nr:hypothetical protein [Streptomyces graminilatus]
MKKSRGQIVADNMWGSAALFVCAAFVSFNLLHTDSARAAGWIFYFCGWIPPTAMTIRCLAKHQKPGVGGAFSIGLLILSGFFFWLNHG